MSLKSDKLAKRLAEIQQFIAVRINQDETYGAVSQELVKIAETLAQGKLTLYIISGDATAAGALQNFLGTSNILTDVCKFQIASPPSKPEQTEPESCAKLIFTRASDRIAGEAQSYYPLPTHEKITIGRDPNRSQVLIGDGHRLISGSHAQVQMLKDSVWQICDSSSNGTFINGQRLQGCQILQPGDKINLGSATLCDKSTEFIFDCQFNVQSENNKFDSQILDCDILCLLLNCEQILTEDDKWLLQKATEAAIAKIAVILEIPPETKTIETKAAEIETWLKSKYPGISFELATLLLQPFYPDAETKEVERSFQRQLDKFTKSLETLVKRKPEDILTQRLTAHVQSQLAQIDSIFATQKAALHGKIEEVETENQGVGKDEIKNQMKKALKTADRARERFFKRVKTELNRSKGALLDETRASGLPAKIKEFGNSLQPDPTFKKGYCELELQLGKDGKSSSVNMAASRLCQKLLSQWSADEWKSICNYYGEGGFQGMVQKIDETVNFIPSLSLSKSLFEPPKSINLQPILQKSCFEEKIKTRYRQPGFFGYMFKNLKGQVISGVGSILLVGGLFLGKDPQMKSYIVVGLLPIVAITTSLTYKQDKEAKLEDETERLRDKTINYYESFTRKLVDDLSQHMSITLEEEEQRIRESLETADEVYQGHLAEIERSKLKIKSRTDQYKLQQKNLDKEVAELQKLKRI